MRIGLISYHKIFTRVAPTLGGGAAIQRLNAAHRQLFAHESPASMARAGRAPCCVWRMEIPRCFSRNCELRDLRAIKALDNGDCGHPGGYAAGLHPHGRCVYYLWAWVVFVVSLGAFCRHRCLLANILTMPARRGEGYIPLHGWQGGYHLLPKRTIIIARALLLSLGRGHGWMEGLRRLAKLADELSTSCLAPRECGICAMVLG